MGTVGCLSAQTARVTLQEQLAMESKVRELVSGAIAELRLGTPSALDRAQAALEVARDMNPDEPRVIDGLGCVEWRRGNAKLAQHFFKRAIELNPKYDRAYAHLALIAEGDGNRAAALALLQSAVRMNPLNYRTRNNLAALLISDGRSKEAYQQLLRAAESGGRQESEIKANLAAIKEETAKE